jgi:hypothetical protein
VHRAPGQRGGQRRGAVPGVEDDQRDAGPPGPGRGQAAQQVAHLPDRLAGTRGGGGALRVDERGPGGAQVPQHRGELVLPARDGLAGAVAAAGVVMDVPAAGRALGVRPGIRRRVDREPQPPPPRARVPHLGRRPGGHAGQRLLQQAVVNPVMLSHPGLALVPAGQPGKRAGQQRSKFLLVDAPGGQSVIQRAVAAAELRHQRQLRQRRHRMISAQDRINQLEGRIRPGGQALIQPGPELPQRLVRLVPGDGGRDLAGIRRLRRQPARRQGTAQAARTQDGLRLPA